MKLKYYLRGIGVGIVVTSLILYLATSGKTSMTDEEIKARAKELGMIENMTLQNVVSSNKSSDKVTSSANAVYATSNVDKKSASDNVADTVLDNKNSSVYGLNDKTESDAKNNIGNDIDNDIDNDKSQDLVAQKPADEAKLTEEKTDNKENKAEDKTENKPEDKTDNKIEDKTDIKIDVISDNSADDENNTSTSTNIETISITIIAGDSSYSAAKKLQKEGIVQSAALFDEYLCKNGYDKRLVVGTHKIPKNASDEEIAKIITGKK